MSGHLYCRGMRTAALLLVLAIGAIALDRPLFCVDGCDQRDAEAHHSAPVPCGGCATCQTARLPESQIELDRLSVSILVILTFERRPPSVVTNGVDHPPRVV